MTDRPIMDGFYGVIANEKKERESIRERSVVANLANKPNYTHTHTHT